jgi:hypothetical protein
LIEIALNIAKLPEEIHWFSAVYAGALLVNNAVVLLVAVPLQFGPATDIQIERSNEKNNSRGWQTTASPAQP